MYMIQSSSSSKAKTVFVYLNCLSRRGLSNIIFETRGIGSSRWEEGETFVAERKIIGKDNVNVMYTLFA